MKLAATAAILLAAGCATAPRADLPLTGRWGGTHVDLHLTADGGTLEYDCAAGTIAGPLVLRRDGSFTAVGTHTPGWGGPERSGEIRPSFQVRYSGRVSGERMTLTGRVENGVLLGPFTLGRGQEAVLLRCL